MLVEVEAKLVDFSSASVEDQGVKGDRSQVDKLYELHPHLVDRQLAQLRLDRHQEVALIACVRSSTKHLNTARGCVHFRLEIPQIRVALAGFPKLPTSVLFTTLSTNEDFSQ